MTPTHPLGFVLALAMAATPACSAPAAQGLCAATETTYFSCSTSNERFISLCGTAPQNLQYRFGKPTQVELAFPAQAAGGARQFLFSHYFRSQADLFEIRFQNADVEYVLFHYTEDGSKEAGVRINLPAKPGSTKAVERRVNCRGPATSRLIDLQEMVPCDTDNALSGGSCR